MTELKTWFFTEDCYPDLPPKDEWDSIRVELPNSLCEPENANRLYNQYLDIWCAADEMGLEIMINEHHQTPTCMVPAAPIMLGILARQTKKSRLLLLGNPLPNRNQPVRVAEEMAFLAVMGPVHHVTRFRQRIGNLTVEVLVILYDQYSHDFLGLTGAWPGPLRLRHTRQEG